ncbi:MAG: hypothetical protein Q9166_006875 [cf. Caloplaca sp. 2 TL-2023]
MQKTYLLFLLALTKPYITTAAALPTTDLTSRAQSECASTFRVDRATCARAILDAFPTSTNISQFHRGIPADLYQLPRTAVGGNTVGEQCRVTVDLQGTEKVEGSWHYVWTMAGMLIDACGRASDGKTGGSMVIGGENGLGIIIQEASQGL